MPTCLPAPPAGPKRKNLRVRNPEKYQWKPAELLKQLARVYLNLSRADRAGDFVAAIAADQRSYHEGIFVEAAEVRGREECLWICCSRGLCRALDLMHIWPVPLLRADHVSILWLPVQNISAVHSACLLLGQVVCCSVGPQAVARQQLYTEQVSAPEALVPCLRSS